MVKISPDGEKILRLSIAMIVLTALAVFLRFLTRVRTKATIGADDWWLVASLVFYYTYMGLQIWMVVNGGIGYALNEIPFPVLFHSLKMIYVSTPFSISTTAAAKISILCLYRRIFTTESFRRNSLIVELFVGGYWLAAVIGSLTQCTPVQAAWDKLLPGKCINFAAFFLGLELVNCLLDVIMLCLPIQVIRTLHMPPQRKIQLFVIFLLGGLVLVAGIIRMGVIYKAGSSQLTLVGDLIWATIENGLAIICACLPTYRPLLTTSQAFLVSVNSWYSSLLSRGSQSKASGFTETEHVSDNQSRKRYNQIADGTQDNLYLAKAVGGSGAGEEFGDGKDYPLGAIKVKSTTEVV